MVSIIIPLLVLLAVILFFPHLLLEYANELSPQFFRNNSDFIFFIIKISILAPLYEELIFDGGFLKNKILKTISYVGLAFFVFHFNLTLYSGILLILFFVLSVLHKVSKSNKTAFQNSRIIINAILFSVMHLSLDAEIGLFYFISLFLRFGFHLLALWLVINFKLLHAILLHTAWNSIMIVGVIGNGGLEMKEGPWKKLENEVLKIEYQQASNFSGKETMNLRDKYCWEFKAVNLEDVFLIKFQTSKKMLKKNFSWENPFYNMEVQVKDSAFAEKPHLLKKEFIDLLIKDSLLVKK